MNYLYCVALFCQSAADYFGHHNRAVASTRAAERDCQVIFPFGDVVRKQVGQKIFDFFQKYFCLFEGPDVTGYARIFSAEAAELGNEMWIRQKPYIEN